MEFTVPSWFMSAAGSALNHSELITDQSWELTALSPFRSPASSVVGRFVVWFESSDTEFVLLPKCVGVFMCMSYMPIVRELDGIRSLP